MSYDVVMAVNHLVHITVDGENIVHSPFMATVEPATLAVGETLILLPPPPLPLVGVSIAMERERQQNDSLVDG